MGEDWRTVPMRQRIIQQIDEHLKLTPEANKRSAVELENSIFLKAAKKEEYLQFVSKIIMFLKEQVQSTNTNSSNLTAILSSSHGNNAVQSSISQGVTSGGQMTLVNATGNQMVQHNQQQQMTENPQLSHATTSGGQITHVGLASGQNMGPNTMVTGPMVAGANRMPPAMQGMTNQAEIPNWAGQGNKVRRPGNINMKHPQGTPNMGANVSGQVGKMGGNMQMQMNDPQNINQMGVGQMPRQAVAMQPRGPSPSFQMAPGGPQMRQPIPNQNIASPQHGMGSHSMSFISPSPSSNVPSPASVGRGMNQHGVPSPSSTMINTPGQQQQQSPASVEDRAYLEKVKQLQDKYLPTLREVAQKLGSTDNDRARKVRNLLDVIENPHRKTLNGMETLQRCELVLQRIEMQHWGTNRSDHAHGRGMTSSSRVGVLFDAINFAMKSPLGQHTIHRTLSPALKVLAGPDLEPILPDPPPKRAKKTTESAPSSSISQQEGPVISEIIQGEVARLPPRFKANLDLGSQLVGSDDLTLIFQLDDPNLPCIPPISIIIPSNYPEAPPRCRLAACDYDTTPFLKKVKSIMTNRQYHLPEVCTITILLDAWEMSVRRGCSSKPFIPDSLEPLINMESLFKM